MRKFVECWGLIVLSVLFINSVASQKLNFRQGEVIVWLNEKNDISSVISHYKSLRTKGLSNLSSKAINTSFRIYKLQFDFAEVSEDWMIQELKKDPRVFKVQKNHLLTNRKAPNDTYFNRQWQHLNDGTLGGKKGADMRTTLAWDISTGGLTEQGDTIVVCVIDGGLDYNHADLKSNIWINREEIPGNAIDDDGNGYVDDFRGWNTEKENDSVGVNNHGTQVCGIIGAIGNNRVGVAGINWAIKIMMVQGGGDEANAIASYMYPWTQRKIYNESNGKHGSFIVATNSSWGLDFGKPEEAPIWCAMYDSLGSVGILNACSTTNLDVNVDIEGDLPTNCESSFLIGVTNINWDDQKDRAGFGVRSIDIGAYGEEIFGTAAGNTFGYFQGTSAASPMVAGAIALLYSIPCSDLVSLSKSNPAEAALLARDIILSQGRKLKSLENLIATGSVLDIYSAVQAIVPLEVKSDSNQIVFKPLLNPINGSVLQYRMLGETNWSQIPINGLSEIFLKNLEKCVTYEYRVLGLCDRYKNSFSNIRNISTKGCCIAPEKIEIIEQGIDNVIISFRNIANTPSFIYTIQELGSTRVDTFYVNNHSDEILILNGLRKCNSYYLRLINYCGDKLSAASEPLIIITKGCDQCDDIDYCKRDRPSAGLEWLESISVDGILYESGNNSGYGNFVGTQLTWELQKGAKHRMEITPGFDLDSSLMFMAAWIDINHNSIFEDNENVLPFEYRSKERTEFEFNIPGFARTGITRMRVIVKYGENGIPAPQPCFAGIEFGEFEDYCVRIVDKNCSSVIDVKEIIKTPVSVQFKFQKNQNTDVVIYKYRKLPYGLWKEGRMFDDNLLLTKLDSCSDYELQYATECDVDNSKEKSYFFNTKTGDCLISTKDLKKSNCNIFPNPANHLVNIVSNEKLIHEIEIYNLQGSKIYSVKVLNHSCQLDNILSKGIYFIKVRYSDNKLEIKKLIVN